MRRRTRSTSWDLAGVSAGAPLGPAEAGRLAGLAASGDAGARWELVASVLPLVRRLARYEARRRRRGNLLDDFTNAGLAAVWEAAHRYDPGRGAFTTFASRVAFNGFADLLSELGYAARVPHYLVESGAMRAARTEATRAKADALAATPEAIGVRPSGLVDVPVEDPDPAEAIDRADLLDRLCALRSRLTARERRALALRLRLGMTHREAGRLMGVSFQAVQQAEARAIGKLRAALGRVGGYSACEAS